MADEETKKIHTEEAPSEPPPPPPPPPPATKPEPADVAEDQSHQTAQELPEESKALAVVEHKPSEGSIDRDAVLARLESDKKMSLVKAWEESEKSKAENKAQKQLSDIGSWENRKKAVVEAELRSIEEKLEKKKTQYVEKMQNKIAAIHKLAEEKRAMIEAKRGEDLLKTEELAANYRVKGLPPKKFLGVF